MSADFQVSGRDLSLIICGSCGIEFAVPTAFKQECLDEGGNKSFFCPNGHRRSYVQSTSDKLRKVITSKDTEISSLQRLLEEARRKGKKR
jgi:hypothetical protein